MAGPYLSLRPDKGRPLPVFNPQTVPRVFQDPENRGTRACPKSSGQIQQGSVRRIFCLTGFAESLLPGTNRRAIQKGNPGSCSTRNRGWHGAVNAPMHGYQLQTHFLRPRPTAYGPGSTLIQRKTPTRGQGPQRSAESKQVSAWLIPSFIRLRRADAWAGG